MTRERILSGSLWLAILLMAMWVGGTLYQMVVVVPLWTASFPESLRSFLTMGYTQTVLQFFGPPFIAARTLTLLIALVAGWTSKPHRRWLAVAFCSWLFVAGFTLLYIYPINDRLFVDGLPQLPVEQIHELLERWIVADRFRFIIGCVTFVAVLRAFRESADKDHQMRSSGTTKSL
jgi:hypothetical protein